MNQELQRNSFFHSVEEVNQFLLWIEILRSGTYKQGTGTLQKGDQFCCLGVACDLLIDEDKKMRNDIGCLAGAYVTEYSQPDAPRWLKLINRQMERKTAPIKNSVADLNDIRRMSFNSIADTLEFHFKGDVEAWADLTKTEDEQDN